MFCNFGRLTLEFGLGKGKTSEDNKERQDRALIAVINTDIRNTLFPEGKTEEEIRQGASSYRRRS